MVENQNKLFIPYWIFSILGTLAFIITIVTVCTDYRELFFDNLTLHLLSCGALGVISAGIQIMFFDKNSIFILINKDSKLINIIFKVILFIILAYSSLIYIFKNPNFQKNQIIIGFIFWVSNLFSLEVFEHYVNKITGEKSKLTTYEFNKKNEIIYSALITVTLFTYAYSGLKSNIVQSLRTGRDMSYSFDIYHAISAIIIGMLASFYYMLMKRIFLSQIKKNGLEIYFWAWVFILLFLLCFYYWINALFFFSLITLLYYCVIIIKTKESVKAQLILNSILILNLFCILGALTIAALDDYPKNSFLAISITNLCFWIANIFTPVVPVVIEKVKKFVIEKVKKCPNVPT